MELTAHTGGAQALLNATLAPEAVGLAWLGQAGFLLRHGKQRILIDPYLSDHLARKYAGKEFPHVRMMPPPIEAGDVRELDLVLCSHRHSDHMDPGSLPALAQNNPHCRFAVPRADVESATKIGLDESRLVPVNDGDVVRVSESFQIRIIPAAHETLRVNERGEHHYLGFIVRCSGLTLYHSGDCVVYDGLAERLKQACVDVALLPVNGRSERLTARGILGNMNFDEARDLCLSAGIGTLIPHHFGMFDFNTVDPEELQRAIAHVDAARLMCVLPRAEQYYLLA